MRKCYLAWAFVLLTSSVLGQLPAQSGVIRTVAGGGSIAGPAQAAFLNVPDAVVRDAAGNLYIALAEGEQVVKLDALGQISVVAGTGFAGYSGDGGPAAQATLNLDNLYANLPTGLALDAAGNLYISDSANNVIRKVALATGIITTVAGNGTAGYSGDGGPATSAELDLPMGVAVDAAGNLYIADGNAVVRRGDASTGVITSLPDAAAIANNGGLDGGVAVDPAGDVFVSEPALVQEISVAGDLTTVAGNGSLGYSGDGGPATAAELNGASAVALDAQGDLFILDAGNNVIRRVVAASGDIATVAGNGVAGFSGDGGPATQAELNPAPLGLFAAAAMAVDPQGDLFFPDAYNHRVRELQAASGSLVTLAGGGTGGDGGPATSATLGFLTGVDVDPQGNVLIHEVGDGRIRELDASTGALTTFAGDGIPVYPPAPVTPGEPATAADLALGNYGFVDPSGNLYIADGFDNNVLRVDAATGTVAVVAGTGHPCTSSNIGDGGPATAACLSQPTGVVMDAYGNLYVTERTGFRIRKIDTSGTITTIAGNGTRGCTGDGGPASAAELNNPLSLALDAQGGIDVSDCNDIRRIDVSTGVISTIAGNGSATFNGESGPATSLALGFTRGLSFDSQGNLFIADPQFNRIFRLDAASGLLSTVAGSGSTAEGNGSFTGDGGLATAATLDTPYGVAVAGSHLFIADGASNRLREVDLPAFLAFDPGALDFGSQPLHSRTALPLVLRNTGTQPLRIRRIRVSGGVGDFTVLGTRCYGGVAPGSSWTLKVVFRPRRVEAVSASLVIESNAVLSNGAVPLSGAGVVKP